MKKFWLIFIIALLFLGCDNRTTDPEDEVWSWIHVFENGNLIYDEVFDETDNGYLVLLPLSGGEEATLSKFVNIHYDGTDTEEEIARDYIVLAEKEDYFTRFYSCSYLDTMFIDVTGGFSPIPSGQVAGAIFTEDYYPIAGEDFHVLQDTLIVADISTNGFGQFANDSLAFGNFGIVIQSEFPYGDTLSFNVNGFYKDYYLDFDGEE